ncbi:hypothetical protein PTKIN_Ptkin03bG0127400 [Pterospermum kingtungense]
MIQQRRLRRFDRTDHHEFHCMEHRGLEVPLTVHEVTSMVTTFKPQYVSPWMCAGDFNELLLFEEKVGGALRPMKQLEAFGLVLGNCSPLEIPFNGPMYTWVRDDVMERMDRGLQMRIGSPYSLIRWKSMFLEILQIICL